MYYDTSGAEKYKLVYSVTYGVQERKGWINLITILELAPVTRAFDA